jgi:membrane protease YdiL (CAAX protease family)
MNEKQTADSMFSLTRLTYSVSAAVILYVALLYLHLYLARAQKLPDALSHTWVWFYASDLFFVIATLVVILSYRPKAELFHWPSSAAPLVAGILESSFLGIGYGLGAFILASPLFWIGDRRVETFRFEIDGALSLSTVLAISLVIVVLAGLTEIVCRGIVLKTLATDVGTSAAIFGSAVLFAAIYPILAFPTAIIVGLASGILYHRTRNLLAPIIATIVFTLSGASLSLYHFWLHPRLVDSFFRIGR